MPKLFGRNVPPVMIGAAGLLAIVVVSQALSSGDDTKSTGKRPKSQVKKSLAESDYLDTDYKFQIAPLPDTIETKDVFRPLVSKGTADKAGNQTIDNFSYSGMAQLNGVANGLLENSQTGQGDFVQEGQTWHDHVVLKVTGDDIELRNSNGDVVTLLAGVSAAKGGPAAAPAAAPPTGNPVMVGPIGASDLSIQADASAGGFQNQGGGRRRGRRGGGGNGGGAAAAGG